jgi:hypothetical protein
VNSVRAGAVLAAALVAAGVAAPAAALPFGGACAPAAVPGPDVIGWATSNTAAPGWLGADTSGSAVTGDRMVWFFGDTVVGSPGATNLVSSSAVVVDGNCATPVFGPGNGPLYSPGVPGQLAWSAGAVTVGARIFAVFSVRDVPAPGQLAGTFRRNVLLELRPRDLAVLAVHPMPSDASHFLGNTLVAMGGKVYVYGSIGNGDSWPRHSVVARFDPAAPQRPWEFLGATGWSASLSALAALPGVPATVTPTWEWRWGDGVALAVGDNFFDKVTVDLYWSPAPSGPFRRLGFLTEIPQPTSVPGGFVYVAGVTPLDAGHLQLAWNVNSFDPNAFRSDPTFYFPRFLTLPMPPVPRATSPAQAVRTALTFR